MWLILIAFCLDFARHGIIFPFIPLLAEKMGAGPATIGFIVGSLISVFAVMATSIRLIFGRLLDIFDRKKVLAYSMLAIILAVGLIPSVASVAGFAVLIAIFGLGFGMTQPLSMVMISDLTNPTRSGLAMGLRFSAIMLAGLLSPIILGFIIEAHGLAPAFYVAALVVVAAGILMFIIRPDLIPARRL
jgi:MFS family permease